MLAVRAENYTRRSVGSYSLHTGAECPLISLGRRLVWFSRPRFLQNLQCPRLYQHIPTRFYSPLSGRLSQRCLEPLHPDAFLATRRRGRRPRRLACWFGLTCSESECRDPHEMGKAASWRHNRTLRRATVSLQRCLEPARVASAITGLGQRRLAGRGVG
jgi:hypothetical protein